ncbi:MAG: hypothetical protein IPM69_01315 [Ignavibacteria bacterium]|nr:hypothetical protein [Ignavibacteria bacterium]
MITAGTHQSILGGQNNTISAGASNTISGGQGNVITTGNQNSIVGGLSNTIASGDKNAILGGGTNNVSGGFSFALGSGNTAVANSFALGTSATAAANQLSAHYTTGYLFNNTMIGNFTSNAVTHNFNSSTSLTSTAPTNVIVTPTAINTVTMSDAGNVLTNTANVTALAVTGSGDFAAEFTNTTNANGISIKVGAGTPNNDNDFVRFLDQGGTTRGRIEGQTIAELVNDAEYQWGLASLGMNVAALAIDGVIGGLELAQSIAALTAASTSSTGCVGLGACVTAPIPSFIISEGLDVVLKTANVVSIATQIGFGATDLALYISTAEDNIGVTYESGSGDYAEWIPKLHQVESFKPGDIVAIKEGKITKNTVGASQLMIISRKPILLGNMPEPGTEKDYEKVAFMGQVPVAVQGKVNKGDYILPNGMNSGVGIAISPDKMTVNDYKNIVGVAWSASTNNLLNQINVAVGLNTHDISVVVEKQATEIAEMKRAFGELNSVLAKLVPGFKSENSPLAKYSTSSSPTSSTPQAQSAAETSPILASNPTSSVSSSSKDEVITRLAPPLEKGKVIYWEITKSQMEQSVDMALAAYSKAGGKIEENPYLFRLKTDKEFRAKEVSTLQSKVKESFHSHQDINQQDSHSGHAHD